MNILFVTHYSGMYGANFTLVNLASEYKSRGISVYVLCPSDGDLLSFLSQRGIECKVVSFKIDAISRNKSTVKKYLKPIRNGLFNRSILNDAIEFAKSKAIDIIHTNSMCVSFGALLAQKMGLPHIWHLREYLEDDYNLCVPYNGFRRRCYAYTDKFIAISNSIKEKYSDRIPSEKIQVIYDGVECKKTYPQKNNHSKFVFVIVGLVSKNKGTLEAIAAFKQFAEKYPDLAELWVIGGGIEGVLREYADKIYSIANDPSMKGSIKLMGQRFDVGELLNQCDCGLMCSKKEAFGRVTIEYMQHKLPVIGSNSGGTLEIIDDGTTGFLYESGNVNDLAEKMEYVYWNREALGNMIDAAYQKAIGYFSIERCANEVIEMYNEIALNDKPRKVK